ncbi:MAG: adenylosuccinate synthase [Synergistales bacterium]|nr:adenylosuccinate synthase [Synergistales bacterium]
MDGRAEVIVGAQWGDEGKGRVVDTVAGDVDVIARFQGGANAGHTVIVGKEKYIFHLLPSGMLYSGKTCVIGNGVVVDPDKLLEELGGLQEQGKDRARLVVSGAAHVVFPYHKILDGAEERFRGREHSIGTTRRGIGPCYVDKVNRMGIRVEDLLSPDTLREKLSTNLEIKNLMLSRVFGEDPLSFDEIYNKARSWGKSLAPYVGDCSVVISDALSRKQGVLLEGAQGTLLDVDHGTYPYVTSSNPVAQGALTGTGLGPSAVGRVIGVVKAYCTRVGSGPFPSEEKGESGQYLREQGGEYGATTGRPRRCGWLDMVALKYAIRVNGIDAIALTKLDVLTGLETVKVVEGYTPASGAEQSGTVYPNHSVALAGTTPAYSGFPGWDDDISGCTAFEELPQGARDYLRYIEEQAGVPVVLIGVGPERDQTIRRGL